MLFRLNSPIKAGSRLHQQQRAVTAKNLCYFYNKDKVPPENTFYRRELPPNVVPFSSEGGRKLFQESLAQGDCEAFFPLIEQFQTQSEPAYCGLTTLVVILNALALDPKRIWRSPWRWFSENMLDCTPPLIEIQTDGLTAEDFIAIARCNGSNAVFVRDASLNDFRSLIKNSMRRSNHTYCALSFSRTSLNMTGTGHWSPLAAYHEGTDSVLVLDVARFKYPPYWASLQDLWLATHESDTVTGLPRGLALLSRATDDLPIFCRLACNSNPSAILDVCRQKIMEFMVENAEAPTEAICHPSNEASDNNNDCKASIQPELARLVIQLLTISTKAFFLHAGTVAPIESLEQQICLKCGAPSTDHRNCNLEVGLTKEHAQLTELIANEARQTNLYKMIHAHMNRDPSQSAILPPELDWVRQGALGVHTLECTTMYIYSMVDAALEHSPEKESLLLTLLYRYTPGPFDRTGTEQLNHFINEAAALTRQILTYQLKTVH